MGSGKTSHIPAVLGDYRILGALREGQSWLAEGPGGRRVVLKRLHEDCLLGGQLHPSIRLRLERVRELAHAGVANLHGVERDGELSYLVWEYLEGVTLQDLSDGGLAMEQRAALGRELMLCVEALHALGLVHGAIHGRNVIIEAHGRVRLIHLSPLLYDEPEEDVRRVRELMGEAPDVEPPADEKLVALPKGDTGGGTHRKRALLGAAGAALAGLVLALGVWGWVSANSPIPPAPPETEAP